MSGLNELIHCQDEKSVEGFVTISTCTLPFEFLHVKVLDIKLILIVAN